MDHPDPEQRARVQENLQSIANTLVRTCTAEGFVLTVEQRPLQPLAMGHYQTVATVRPARGVQ